MFDEFDDELLAYGVALLDITPQDIEAVTSASDVTQGNVAKQNLCSRVKKRFRQVALDVHPDISPYSDELFKVLCAIVEMVRGLEVVVQPKTYQYQLRGRRGVLRVLVKESIR